MKFLYKNRAIRLHLTIAITVQFSGGRTAHNPAFLGKRTKIMKIIRLVGRGRTTIRKQCEEVTFEGEDRRQEETTSKLLKQLGESA